MSRVLLVGVAKKDLEQLQKIFSSVKLTCETANTMEAAYEKIAANPPALVVAEKPVNADVLHGLKTILQTHAPVTPFLVCLPEASSQMAIECMRAGAFDCLSKPYATIDVLAAAKRAALKNQRTIFTDKILPKKKRSPWPYVFLVLSLIPIKLGIDGINGPPPNTISLGSANLSGIQWEGRSLWVGDWFDSTVTHYQIKRGVSRLFRTLSSDVIYKIRDGQPILVCNTPETFVTIGSDLKMRSHHRAVDMPTLNSVPAPANNPAGLAWSGTDLWSLDSETNLLYRHAADLRVVESVKSILPHSVALAADGPSLWLAGGAPLQVARLELLENGAVWHGPYSVSNILNEGILPTGLAVGFGRLWFVSGGDPKMSSISLRSIHSIWSFMPKSKGKV